MNGRRVVITGMGIYSTIGLNCDAVLESLRQGKSGIGFDQYRKDMGFRSGLTGVIERPDLKNLLNRRLRIGLPEQGEYAYMATMEALKSAGLELTYMDDNEVGILYGNDSSSIPVIESIDIVRAKKDTALIGSGHIFRSMNSTVSMNLSVILKLRGINFTISGACASSSHAIGMAGILISQGLQEMIICGGAQEINPESMGSFDGLNAFSMREHAPAEASRPFDKARDGLVPSGGAATVIVESLESARRRGATILGELIGYGFSSNGDHISVPNVEGPSVSLKRAIEQSGISAKEIGYVNAHATSTPVGDINEAKALARFFGDSDTWVSSTKSMTGHEMWMGGASEVVYSLLMMKHGFIAPNINLTHIEDAAKPLRLATKMEPAKFDSFLSNSFGFGGTNSTLVVREFRD